MNKNASWLLIILVSASLTACGQRKPLPRVEEAPRAPVNTQSNSNIQQQDAGPGNVKARPHPVQHTSTRGQRTSKSKSGGGSTRSCSTRTNGEAILSGTVAIGLTFAAGFIGPLLFVPALIAAANTADAVKASRLMRAAMKIVLANSDNNQLVGYAQDFLDRKKKIPTRAEMSAFNEAKESLEKKIRKMRHSSRKRKIFIPNVEFAERVFTYDLRGDICEGGIKGFDRTVDLIEELSVSNQIEFRTNNQCEGSCGGSSSQKG